MNFCKTIFFCLLFSIKISVFSVSVFLLGLSRTKTFFHVLFFCLFKKNGFPFLCNSPFLILRFKSVSLFYCPFFLRYPRITKVVFDGNDGKTLFCFLFLFSWFFEKTMCVRKICCFSLFLKLKAQKIRQKSLPFLFLSSLLFD